MHSFFADSSCIKGNTVTIGGSDYNHIKNVLRLKAGEEVSVITGEADREYRCAVEGYDETAKTVKLSLLFVKEDNIELPCRIYLFQGLPKGDKLEFIIQKSVELGAYQIIPVATKRSVVKLDEKKLSKRNERYNAISEAAAKQSKRRIIPEVMPVMSFSDAISYCREQEIDIRLFPYELCDTSSMERTREIFGSIKPQKSVAVFIGPEGGFSAEEAELAEKEGFFPVTLGKRILRTETAGLAVLSWLVYLLEE
ncbi:MAG: 16S rRNA (uracil(1498)-N(3))-methyltransferase [Lachnospiraceae bacterium]|nr:16S rRNA (uracil(1498)-N(3))-methyltransferase [Lachnospiraceae bacterium]